jgi:PucR C-terminal helix-turn-helix domain
VTNSLSGMPSDRLQSMLPRLVDELPAVLDEVSRLLREDWTEYADFLDRHRDEVAAAGAMALGRIVQPGPRTPDLGRNPGVDPPPDVVSSLFEEIGRAQYQRGNRLTLLLSAYQTGARAAWRQVARIAVEQGLPAAELAILADSVFGFVDQLSSASARGYVAEQSEAAAGRERARADLADLLLSGSGDPRAIEEAAHRAGWMIPMTAAIVLVEGDRPGSLDALTRGSGAGWLPINRADGFGLILSDPAGPGRHRRLTELLNGSGAVIGPTVELSRLPVSLRMTRIALRLRRTGVITDDPVFLDEHIDAVIVHQDDLLLTALERQVLQPLAALPAMTRRRLEETLSSWLRHMGDRGAVAEELHIHRQTVRYRLAQLHELFGDAMTDPDRRMPLMLALGWRPVRTDNPAEPPAQRGTRRTPGGPSSLIDLRTLEQRRPE